MLVFMRNKITKIRDRWMIGIWQVWKLVVSLVEQQESRPHSRYGRRHKSKSGDSFDIQKEWLLSNDNNVKSACDTRQRAVVT